MAPKSTRTRLSSPKRRGTPVTADTTSAASKSKKTKKSAVSLEVEMPDAKPLQGTRRSPSRVVQKVKGSLTRIDVLKENVKRGQEKVKKEQMEEEEEEEEMMVDIPLKEQPDSEMSDGEETTLAGLSEYEKRRLENISKNADFFASLDIFKAKENLVALTPQAQKPRTQTRGLKSQKSSESAPVVRRPRSLRLQNKSPDGTGLPENFKEPSRAFYIPLGKGHDRLPSDPVKMDATNVKKVEKTDAGADFVEGLAALARGEKTSVTANDKDLDKFTSQLQKMKSRYMANVVPDRIFSVAVHPSVEKTIVVAGDKWGKIGLWDVNSSKGDDGVFMFAPHTRPVNCLRFAPSDPNKLFSVSYDGTVRCGDFVKAVFDEVYVPDEDEVIWTSYFDFMSADGSSLLVTQNDKTGYVVVVDTRSRNRKGGENVYNVHSRNAKTVSVHPTMPHYFVTASTDRTAALWDIRSMKRKGSNKPIAEMAHGRSVSSAFFSPITGSKILTTSLDDKISIFDTESAKDGRMSGVKRTSWQRHNNCTSGWLTVLQAAWHPKREDAYVVGRMSQPRRIEVFSSKGKPIHHFLDEQLGSVSSINEFHPTRDLLVGGSGGNCSGKLHVFMV